MKPVSLILIVTFCLFSWSCSESVHSAAPSATADAHPSSTPPCDKPSKSKPLPPWFCAKMDPYHNCTPVSVYNQGGPMKDLTDTKHITCHEKVFACDGWIEKPVIITPENHEACPDKFAYFGLSPTVPVLIDCQKFNEAKRTHKPCDPTDDWDCDGVPNEQDAYPFDPNRSKDCPPCDEKDLESKILREMKARNELLDLAAQRRQKTWKYTQSLVWPAVKSTIIFGGVKLVLGSVLKKYAAGAFPPVAIALAVVGTLESAQTLYELRDEWIQTNKDADDANNKWEELDKQINEDLDQLEACRKSKQQSKSELSKPSMFVLISAQEPQVDVPRIRAALAEDGQTIAAVRNYPGRGGSSPNSPYYKDSLNHLSKAIGALKEASKQLNDASGNTSSAGNQQTPEGDPNMTLTPTERRKLMDLVAGPSLLKAFDELSMAFDLASAQLEHDERVSQMRQSRTRSS